MRPVTLRAASSWEKPSSPVSNGSPNFSCVSGRSAINCATTSSPYSFRKSTVSLEVTAEPRAPVVLAFELAIFLAKTAAGRFSAGMSPVNWL